MNIIRRSLYLLSGMAVCCCLTCCRQMTDTQKMTEADMRERTSAQSREEIQNVEELQSQQEYENRKDTLEHGKLEEERKTHKQGEMQNPTESQGQEEAESQYDNENSAKAENQTAHVKELPSSYDFRKTGRVPEIKSQGELGTCWAFASLTALETSLLPEEKLDFSEDHMSLNHNFLLGQNDGGEYTMSMAYLLSWQGPVLERDDPYGDKVSPEGLKPVKHVQEIQILPEKDYDSIKHAVFHTGGVQSSLYTSLKDSRSESEYYNKTEAAYYYNGKEKPNHDSVIVGWDDNYPKERFNSQPPGDGAFLCVNSWGTEFGDEGLFYVSYYDTNIGIHNIVYTAVEDTDNYDYIYQSDLCGWIGQLGYGSDTAWFSNVYQTAGEERLKAAGFYAIGPNTSYEIYVAQNLDEEEKMTDGGRDIFGTMKKAAEGQLEHVGYYTIPLEEEVVLDAGERFAVIVKVKSPGLVHPVAIEYDAKDGKCSIDLTDGEGYISLQGDIWERVEEKQGCNICLKAYTEEK